MSYDFGKIKVLVVDCQPSIFELLKSILSALTVQQKNIFSAYTVEEAFEKYRLARHHLIIIDWLEDPNAAITLTRLIRIDKLSPNHFVPIIMTAGSGHERRVLRARDAGISEYLVKPFSAGSLAERITRVVEDEKQFVISDDYVGPDRRVSAEEYTGPERRQDSPRYKAEQLKEEIEGLREELTELQQESTETLKHKVAQMQKNHAEASKAEKARAEKARRNKEALIQEAKLKDERAKLQKEIQDLRKKKKGDSSEAKSED